MRRCHLCSFPGALGDAPLSLTFDLRRHMKTPQIMQLITALVAVTAGRVEGAELGFYERFTSLVQTNGYGPDLTNTTLLLLKTKQVGELAGVKLGMGMSAAVEKWGKPRFFSGCRAGCPVLMFGHGSMAFIGDSVVRVSISPNMVPGLCFEGGLTATNTPTEFARVLGVPTPGPAQWALDVDCPAGVLVLRWTHFKAGGWQLGWLSLEQPESARDRGP
jgi:hypothetical protein